MSWYAFWWSSRDSFAANSEASQRFLIVPSIMLSETSPLFFDSINVTPDGLVIARARASSALPARMCLARSPIFVSLVWRHTRKSSNTRDWRGLLSAVDAVTMSRSTDPDSTLSNWAWSPTRRIVAVGRIASKSRAIRYDGTIDISSTMTMSCGSTVW